MRPSEIDWSKGLEATGYESPIQMIMKEMVTKFENDCLSAVQSYGFNIDREELAKALKYDRDQYAKGYRNGHIDGVLQGEKLYARPHGEWIDHSDEGYVECPFCGSATTCEDNKDELHYCWNCGAEMRQEETKDDG